MTTVNKFASVVTAATTAPGAMDASKESAAFTESPPARAGVALFRMKAYIEKGVHVVKNGKGKGKKQNMADITFELVHPHHLVGEGDNKRPDTITVRNLNISTNPKAKYFKLFKAMNYTGQYTSFPQMLGHAFLGRVVHNVVGDKTYVNMEEDGNWLIGAPRYAQDPINAPEVITEVPVPEMSDEPQLFLFDNPGVDADMVKLMWDSITITGEKNNGDAKKNWICDMIRTAVNWEGSFVQSVVGGAALVEADIADDVADSIADATGASLTPAADDAVASTATTTAAAVDPLAGIPGL